MHLSYLQGPDGTGSSPLPDTGWAQTTGFLPFFPGRQDQPKNHALQSSSGRTTEITTCLKALDIYGIQRSAPYYTSEELAGKVHVAELRFSGNVPIWLYLVYLRETKLFAAESVYSLIEMKCVITQSRVQD